MLVRKAEPKDLTILNDLMFASKGYWEYDSTFMQGFITLYCSTELEIASGRAFVAMQNGDIIGFYYFCYERNGRLLCFIQKWDVKKLVNANLRCFQIAIPQS